MIHSPNSKSLQPSDRQTRALLVAVAVLTAAAAGAPLLPEIRLFHDPTEYLPLHTGLEFIAMAVSVMVFSLGWNLRRQADNSHAIVLAATFLGVALLDFAHTQTFVGMPDLIGPSGLEKTINFWLAGRAMTALGLLAVAILPLRTWPPLTCFAAVAAGIAVSMAGWWIGFFHADWMPRTFVPGQGLTAFKIGGEHVLSLVYCSAALLMIRRGVRQRTTDLYWLAAGSWVLGLSEWYFTLFAQHTDMLNVLGHVYKVTAYVMLYRAVFVAGVLAPYRFLAEERARLRSVIDAVPDFISFKDTNSAYLGFNKAFASYCGRSESELIGKADSSFASAEMAEAHLIEEREIVATGKPRNYEEVGQFADGRDVVLETLKTPYFAPDGELLGLIRISRDITERKRSETALRDSEERFRLLFDSNPMPMWVSDNATFRFLTVNDAAIEHYGYTREEFLAMTILDIRPVEDHDAVRRIAGTGKADRRFGHTWRHLKSDGTKIDVAVFLRFIEYQGRSASLAAVIDVTERKQMEDRLRQAAAVFANTHDGMTITDPTGNMIAVNRAFCAITGYSEAEALGQNPRILRSGRQDDDFYKQMWLFLTANDFWRGEIWNRRKSGAIYPELLTISAVRNDAGKLVNYIGIFTDISDLKQSELRLQHLAHHDPLTDLPNRLLLLSKLDDAVKHAKRSGIRGAVMLLDLDRFKNVNDSLGHPAGDELLVLAAQRLRDAVPDTAVLARMGGDEFIVLLNEISHRDGATDIARKLIDRFKEQFVLSGGHEVGIGASIGISLFPDDGEVANDLVQHADAALYQAKDSGRNTYGVYCSVLTRAANARLQMERDLRRAIERDEFVLHYQPLISLADGRISGVEALIRWQVPNAAIMTPDNFIPLAEETGLITPIGDWVLRAACSQMRAWIDAGLPLESVAVNLSSRQLAYGDIDKRIGAILRETALPPKCLELELTESALLEQGDDVVGKLVALKGLGVRLAIDDFGTGYSSLAYLARFPIDKLKIDQSFVRNIPDDRAATEITATIITLAKTLKLSVIAEGVETQDQLEFVRRHGCDNAQGYLFSRPLPGDDVRRFVEMFAATREKASVGAIASTRLRRERRKAR